MRIFSSLLAVAVVAATVVTVSVTPARAADIDVRPARLDRGPDPRGPRIVGGDVVDGDRRIDVPGTGARFGAEAGDDHLVTSVGDDGVLHLWRVGDHPPVDLANATDDGYSTYLDFDGRRVVLGGSPGLVTWNVGTGRTARLDARPTFDADLAADRAAFGTRDGCAVVTTVAAPRRTLWRLLGSYRVARRFDDVRFETAWAFLAQARGTTHRALVRCRATGCERAGKLTENR